MKSPLKRFINRFYRNTIYSFLKEMERVFRSTIFFLLELFFPKFHAFRFFGIPRGISSFEGESLFPNAKILRKPPHAFDEDLISKCRPLEVETYGARIAILQNGFTTATAATLNEKGLLIPEFTEQFTMTHIQRHKLFTFRKERLFSQIPHIDAKVASLTVDGQWNYYHWLFDVLPKLAMIRKKGLDPQFYYGEYSKRFQIETLNTFGIRENHILSPKQYPVLSASSLIVTSFPCLGGIGGVPRWAVDFLRETFLPKEVDPSLPKKIFVSREDADYRRILNQKELLPLIEKAGYVPVKLETLSVADQVALFHSADFVLAPHGAGLTNLAFCRPKTKVIEMFPPRFLCTCFWALSQINALDYYSFKGKEEPSTYNDECEGYDHVVIEPQKLEKILSQV